MTALLAISAGFADTEVRGFIEQDVRWTLDKDPHIAIGRLIVKEGITLTIDLGVTAR